MKTITDSDMKDHNQVSINDRFEDMAIINLYEIFRELQDIDNNYQVPDLTTYQMIRRTLNDNLIERQNIDETDISKIVFVHYLKLIMDDLVVAPQHMQLYNDIFTEMEFVAQDLWKFGRDIRFHQWWFNLSRCTCPKLDNYDMVGSEQSVRSQSCLIHGWSESK